MPAKSQQLQIRVTPLQKARLKRLADRAGFDVSSYVLARALPPEPDRFGEILRSLEDETNRRFALAALSDFLFQCPPASFSDAVARATLPELSPYLRNYVAAMVEQAAYQKGVARPPWVRDIEPLAEPHFVTSLLSLRPHLLFAAPVPFKRRNIFVDASLGSRV
jgi:hypothetical protein